MNRNEFISIIMSLYPDTFKPENKRHYQLWIDRYKNAISDKWDFDKLMWYFDTEYKSTVTPPHPSFFYAYKENVKPEPKKVKTELTEQEKKESHLAFLKFQKDFKKLAQNKSIQK